MRNIMWLGLAGLCAAVLSLAALYLYLDPQVPRAETYRNVQLETPLRIYAADGALLAEFGERRLIPVSLAQVPKHFINALLDTEDKRFYQHSGIDFISLANDMVGLVGTLITEGELGPGASTITMQLARNVSFSLERRFLRKFKEMLLALKIERELSKDEILELYINIVPFGKRAYGAEAAARTYYGKSLNDLTLPQLAMLAGIPQAPSAGNPINGPARALARRNLVLGRMRAQGSITENEYAQAVATPITAQIFGRDLDVASPYASEWVRQLAISTLPDLYTAGYEIFTTIDSVKQASAIKALRAGLLAYDKRHGYRGAEGQLSADLLTQVQAASAEHVTSGPAPDSANETVSPPADQADTSPLALATTYPAEIQASISTELTDIATYGGLEAAAVVAVTDSHALAQDGQGQVWLLDFADADWARAYIDVDLRGPPLNTFTEVVAIGDIIRLQAHKQGRRLAQLPEIQGAVISVDPRNGRVQAIVGGFDFYRNQYNHALQAARQPGSGFKPFVYSAALAAGITAADIFMDAPLVFDDANLESQYRPDNDNNKYNGPTRLREALYRSINLVSMRVLLRVGAGNVLEHASQLGFNTGNFPRNTQLAIGGGTMAITPVDMARAYAIFANGGYLIEPYVIDHIKDAQGVEIFRSNRPVVCQDCTADVAEAEGEEPASLAELLATSPAEPAPVEPVQEEPTVTDDTASGGTTLTAADDQTPITPQPVWAERVLDEGNVFIMDSMLRDVVRRGTGVRARSLKRNDLAGKTGTTNEAADTWFNGYHPSLVTTVWVGFSNHDPLGARAFGSNTPLPIWIDYMRTALKGVPEAGVHQPAAVYSAKIDPQTGTLAAPGQRDAMFEYFLRGTAPAPRKQDAPPNIDQGEVKAIDLF